MENVTSKNSVRWHHFDGISAFRCGQMERTGKKMSFVSSDQKATATVTSRLRKGGRHTDAKIILADGTSFPIHKILLALGSSFFEKLFCYHPDDKEYKLGMVSSETMSHILDWIYGHKMALTDKNVPEILKTAFYLDCFEVVGQCSQYLMDRLDPCNVLGFWQFAVIYQIKELEDKFMGYLTYHFPMVVKEEEEFLKLSLENLILILKRDDLNMDEESVFHALMRWVEHCALGLSDTHLASLIKCMRLGCLSEISIEEDIINHPLVQAACIRDPEVRQLIHMVETSEPHTLDPEYTMPRAIQDIILSIGGWASGEPCNVIESYDYRANKWIISHLEDPMGPRGYLGAAVIDSKLYLVGGTNGQQYLNWCGVLDLATGEGKRLGPMKSARCYMCLETYGGKLYAVGGFDGQIRLNTMEEYTPQNNRWERQARMKQIRSDAGSTVVGDKLCILGGFDGRTQLRSGEAFNFKTNKWSPLTKMTFKRSGLSCATMNNQLYVLGGYDGHHRLNSCEMYSFETKKWTLVCDMDTARSNFSCCIYEGKILVCGGFDGHGTTNQVELVHFYGEDCNRTPATMQVKRSALAVCAVKGLGLSKSVLGSFQSPNRAINELDLSEEESSLDDMEDDYEEISSSSDFDFNVGGEDSDNELDMV